MAIVSRMNANKAWTNYETVVPLFVPRKQIYTAVVLFRGVLHFLAVVFVALCSCFAVAVWCKIKIFGRKHLLILEPWLTKYEMNLANRFQIIGKSIDRSFPVANRRRWNCLKNSVDIYMLFSGIFFILFLKNMQIKTLLTLLITFHHWSL